MSIAAELHARLEAARRPVRPRRVDFGELGALPAPVRRYLRAVLRDGQPMVEGARLRHRGTLNLGGTCWQPFESEQRVSACRPGFDWDARVRLAPGLTVRVHDAYVAGEGVLHGKLMGLLPVVDVHGAGEIADGELMRFLAEATWYPTALLPSQGVEWAAIDATSARATLHDGDARASLAFTFGDDGLVRTVEADARGRMVGGRLVPTPWRGRFGGYEERGGMRIPLEGEVSWIEDGVEKPYWLARIAEVAYDFAD